MTLEAKLPADNQSKARQVYLTSLFYLLGCVALTACDEAEKEFLQLQVSGPTMGTQYHISVVSQLAMDQDTLQHAIDQRLAVINQSMSTYISDSELSRLNQASGEDWFPVSDSLFAVLSLAKQISRESDGAFDITVGPVVNLWGFGPNNFGPNNKALVDFPTQAEIDSLRELIGYDKVQLNNTSKAVKKPSGRYLDLSAIAKGFAADDISQLLLSMGYANHMVEIGGEIMAQGHNARGQAWRIGIENPTMTHSGVQQAVAVSGVGVATSGDYRNYFEVDGERFSHTIDPLTGRPVTHSLASVTVIAPTAMAADAYATAINVLGYLPGRAFAEKYGLAVFFIVRRADGFETSVSTHFSQFQISGNSLWRLFSAFFSCY